MPILSISLPTEPSTTQTLSLPDDDPQRTVEDVVQACLAGWPREERGELLAELGDDDEWDLWGLRAWEDREGRDEDADGGSEAWDDLLPLSSTFPSNPPSRLALTPITSRLVLSFLDVPTVPDHSTLTVYCLPWTTTEQLIEDVCKKHGLIRRLTMGGETKGRGRDKWGGGEKVEYGLEEVWMDESGEEETFPVPSDTHLASLLSQPLHPPPTPYHINPPLYRFCIPQSWLLRTTPVAKHPSLTASPSRHLRLPSDTETIHEPTLKAPTSDSTSLERPANPFSRQSSPRKPSDPGTPGSSAGAKPPSARSPAVRTSIFDSIYSSFSSPTTTTTAALASPKIINNPPLTPTSRPPTKKIIDRMSITEPISEPKPLPLADGRGIRRTDGQDGDVEGVAAEDEEFEQLMDSLGIQGSKRVEMAKLPSTQRAYLLAQSRKTAATSSSISRSTSNPLPNGPSAARLKLQNSGGPPNSYKPPANAPISFSSPTPTAIEPQKTGESSGGGGWKRFSVASLGSWGEIVAGSSASPDSSVVGEEELSRNGGARPLVKQDTGGWGWWGSSAASTSKAGAVDSGEKEKATGLGAVVQEIASAKLPTTPLFKRILALRVQLSTAPVSTIDEFLELGGLEAIETLLGRIVRLNDAGKGEVGDTVLLETVRVVRVISNTETGFTAVISRLLLITHIAFCLHASLLKLRSQVADVLAAISVLGGSDIVLSAFSEFRVAFGETFRFEWLVANLGLPSGEDDEEGKEGREQDQEEEQVWAWRASGFALVNAITTSPDELEERVMLRDEFTRRGLNEVVVGLRYMSPPEALLTQLDLYAEEKAEDQESLRYQTLGRQSDDSLDYSLGQLAKLAQEHSDIYPVLVDTMKRYVQILERDIDDHLKSDLMSILDKFVEHAAQLDNLDDGWKAFMQLFLQSVQPIVLEPGSFKSNRTGSADGDDGEGRGEIPSAFVEEIEDLRTRVEELSDERAKLKDELSMQLAQANTFRSLPTSVSVNFVPPPEPQDSSKPAEKEEKAPSTHGLVQRLVLKEKEVLRLQAEVARLSKSGSAEPRESDEKAKRDRDRAKFNSLVEDVQKARTSNAENEAQLKASRADIKHLKLALDTVHSRLQAFNLDAFASNGIEPPSRDLDPQSLATQAVESLTRKENEIIALHEEIDSLKKQLSTRQPSHPPPPSAPKDEKDFKSRVPPPPPPAVRPKPNRQASSDSPSTSSATLPIPPPPPPPTVSITPTSDSQELPSATVPSSSRAALMASLVKRRPETIIEDTPISTPFLTEPPASPPPSEPASINPRRALLASIRSPTAPVSPPPSPSSVDPPSGLDPRAALMAALRKPKPPPSSGDGEPPSSPPSDADPRQALMAALRKPKGAEPSSPSPSPSETPDSRYALMAALRGGPKPPPSLSLSENRPTPNSRAALLSAIKLRPDPTDAPSSSSPMTLTDAVSTAPARNALMSALKSGPTKTSDLSSPSTAAPPADRANLLAAIGNRSSGSSPSNTTGGGGFARGPPKPPQKKLKPFFWKKLEQSTVESTIWSTLPKETLVLDLMELEETFTMGASVTAPLKSAALARKNQPVTLLDITRSNNVGIMLARLKLPIPKIQQAVLVFDDQTLTLDDLKALSKLLPSADEANRISGFEDVSKLAKPDQYFKEIMAIPRLVERFDCMLFRRRLEMDIAEVVPDLQAVSKATSELRDSSRFKKVLQVILAVGNALNGSTFRGGAQGFEMEALLKLKETRTAKPTPDCPTLLHFIAKMLMKNSPSLVLFIDEIPHLPVAARISFTAVLNSVSSITKGLEKVQAEIKTLNVLAASPPSDRFVPVMSRFALEATSSVDKIRTKGESIGEELKALLEFFGEVTEGPEATKPEDFFGMVLTFSLALQKAAAEVTKHLAKNMVVEKPKNPALRPSTFQLPNSADSSNPSSDPKSSQANFPPPQPPTTLLSPPPTSAGRHQTHADKVVKGELDEAIRSLHGGRRRDREREQTIKDRPLSRVFLDGNNGMGSLKGSVRGTMRGAGGGTVGRGTPGTRTSLGSLFVPPSPQ